ncbi:MULTISPECIES: hypothetical protein [unclassified Pedobacter]|uniref:hypothetical protein n=1 Tax=Pedobacter TaxID=84567 RepID=UPI0022471BB9|nr:MULTISPECIES: hypothetical protein [unclassified Pedobacter]MCX2430538.1 hypothetical protein [Pedobacter sp. GR22-10]MCX2585240.1 hypothetical protein [Pedobacter sp. MR22-3]
MKSLILYFIFFINYGCKAQQEVSRQNAIPVKVTSLFTEVLYNLANRKDNVEKNGLTICIPRFSNEGMQYLPSFLRDGGLNQLSDSTEWLFVKSYLIRPKNLQHQRFDKLEVKKKLKSKGVNLSEHSGLRMGFTPFILNEAENRACAIYYDFFSNALGEGVIANRIIAFYKYENNKWIKVATLPLAIE